MSDTDLDELHRFARLLGVPRRGFQGDHYDLPEPVRAVALELGAVEVESRELLARLRGAGLRLTPAQRRAQAWHAEPLRLDPAAWLGRSVTVVVDRPVGLPHGLSGAPYPVNVGHVPGTSGVDGAPLDAYVLGPDAPLATVEATVIAILRRHDDVEDRLVSATGGSWSADAIEEALAFQEAWFETTLLQ